MNRRAFLTRTLAFLPVPAFARAASLWLPKERPFLKPEPEWSLGEEWIGVLDEDDETLATLGELFLSTYGEHFARQIEREAEVLRAFSGLNNVARGGGG